MNDPETKKDLFEKFKTMSRDDLMGYQSAGKTVERTCSVLGVASIFFILTLQSMFAIGAMAFIVFILAQVAGAASETVQKVNESLERFNR